LGADLIHEDILGEYAKSSKNMQRGLYDNYCLKTVNFPVICVRSETLLYFNVYGTVPKHAVLPLVTIKHSAVLKPNIRHYDSGTFKATSSLGYILRQNDELKKKYIIFIMWVLKYNTLHWANKEEKDLEEMEVR
jgi:hypothetical protein